MTTLLDIRVPRTLDGLVERLADQKGATVEIWTFDDAPSRAAYTRRLADVGIKAILRSAYKPLLHFFLEEVGQGDLASAAIRYPVHAEAAERRFLSEAYPLAALLPRTALTFEAGIANLTYEVGMSDAAGRSCMHPVFAPNRITTDHLDQTVLAPTGWLRITPEGADVPTVDVALETDFEILFNRIIAALQTHPWGKQEPYFKRLDISVDMPGEDRPLPYQDEVVSLREALHEELYFSALEVFKRHSGKPADDRTLQPGQIVPNIRQSSGAIRATVSLGGFMEEALAPVSDHSLADSHAPLDTGRIRQELHALGGESFSSTSVIGRPVEGRLFPGNAPGVLVSAAQHANETSGIVGLLRAAPQLLERGEDNIGFIALENPDGYAMHRELCRDNPRHMHHAARYTALGDDLEYRAGEPYYERGARLEAFKRLNARLHINLHGYPAHEWTRPLTTYLPRGFELWSIPKGFFLILRHHSGLEAQADALIQELTTRLAASPALSAYNAEQLATYRTHAGEVQFPVYNGIPCLVSVNDTQGVPFTLITEYPDETVYGDAFRLAHTTQMETVLNAVDIFRRLESNA
ncbi:peptidase M14 [Lacibacterium aquatile]|uniref:Peptidase M14 n=1 Tax=Lacibacterium aquatile TaxID=1168082 RepID=A0ABW5DPW8_9PROT